MNGELEFYDRVDAAGSALLQQKTAEAGETINRTLNALQRYYKLRTGQAALSEEHADVKVKRVLRRVTAARPTEGYQYAVLWWWPYLHCLPDVTDGADFFYTDRSEATGGLYFRYELETTLEDQYLGTEYLGFYVSDQARAKNVRIEYGHGTRLSIGALDLVQASQLIDRCVDAHLRYKKFEELLRAT